MCIVDSSLFAEKGTRHVDPFYRFDARKYSFWPWSGPERCPWLAQQGGPILLVHGASPQRAAFLRHQLEALQLEVTMLAISREPWLIDIEQGVQLAREKGVRAVVSLGGGAVIDAGKAIAALVPAAGPLVDYLEVVGTGRQLEASPLPVRGDPDHRRDGRGGHQKCGDQRPGTTAESGACATTECCLTWRLSTRR